MISLRKRFLYVHIPKTAGNAIQTALREYADDRIYAKPNQDGIQRFTLRSPYGTSKHSPLSRYLPALGADLFWSLTKFTIVRNPWERAISFYFSPHRNTTDWNRASFLRAMDDLKPMVWFLHLPEGPHEESGAKPIDVMLRHETLDEDFRGLCQRLGIPWRPIPRRNTGTHRPYADYYDAELAALVAERFADDIREFGYHYQ
jgi:Sulfotransferase family